MMNQTLFVELFYCACIMAVFGIATLIGAGLTNVFGWVCLAPLLLLLPVGAVLMCYNCCCYPRDEERQPLLAEVLVM